jgi:type IV secretory pathway VirB4 component
MAEQYYIPRRTKVKTVFIKGLTSTDLIWLAIGAVSTVLLFMSSLWYLMIAGAAMAILTLAGMSKDSAGDRMYSSFIWYFRFFAYSKKFSKKIERGHMEMKNLIPYVGIVDDGFIDYEGYYAVVVGISPVEFGLLGQEAQMMLVNSFANALRRVTIQQSASLIAFEKPLVFDNYIDNEISKYEQMVKNVQLGVLSSEELSAREAIFNERGTTLEYMNDEEKIYKMTYYLVVYGGKKDELERTASGIVSTLSSSLGARRLMGQELFVFLRGNYDKFFNENEFNKVPFENRAKWTMPDKVRFGVRKQVINGRPRTGVVITDFPLTVGNAWGYSLFNFGSSKAVLNFYQVSKTQAEKQIDKAIIEMRSQEGTGFKESQRLESQTQLETIETLLQDLKTNNEQMYNVRMHITTDWENAHELRSLVAEDGFRCSNNFGKQIDSFISSNVSRADKYDSIERGMSTTTLAAAFPFISDLLQDDNGILIGSNSHPVLIDFFKRSNARVNSNMIIIGKSGSGKSFSTKSILANLAADNTKIFICDPEKEYVGMARKLHGGLIDVGNAGNGRFNPFHIYPAMLDDDDAGQEFDDSFEGHLRFLESFFKIVMGGIRSDALESLNGLITRLYKTKGIDKYTDFAKLRAEQFPVFDELYALAKRSYAESNDEFSRINNRVLVTYLEKFAEGGRYSGLWNGPTSIKTDENFFVFNFLTLLSNKNTVVANAQMLLVFKYLDGEIIKNREFNQRNNTKRKIIIVVDEAHVFIDDQRPIALDFMFNMAKRIRKYDGMQIVITQNIKDFVGSALIAKKSAAIINASQYSMIFSLAPNDMTDLVTLYKNAGGINKREQETIIASPRGQCFFIYGPVSRSTVSIETSDEIQQLFE